jgi:hypothetical protein
MASRRGAFALAPVKYDAFRLEGGLDLVTPTLSLKPGVARDGLNFEVSVTGGYSRIAGTERFDGQTSPNSVSYGVITLNTNTGASVGSTITNGTSTAVVAFLPDGQSIVFTKNTGNFNTGDTITQGGVTIGTVQASVTAPTGSYYAALYQTSAANIYRALIQPVPGSGPVRGVVYYQGNVYAWRNNVGGSAMAIYKASSSGWTAVPLGWQLKFTSATGTQPAEGATVTGGTSGATGTIARVAVQSALSWGSGATGFFVLSATSGTFVNGEALKVGGTQIATASGAATAITLNASGRVQAVISSFGNNTGQRVYGADGANNAFEFDGAVYVPIYTGMVKDKPTNVAVHKNFLFLSFGPSLQFSSIGAPYVWTPVLGAGELVMPEIVTALLPLPGTVASGSLCVFSTGNTYVLYGTGSTTWNLVPYNQGVGGYPYTSQNMDNAYALDERGVVTLSSSLNYGNFDSATLTLPIRPFTQAHKGLATASALNREKSQYRVFYSDGYGLYCTIVNGKFMGSMPVYFPDPVMCWTEGDNYGGVEVSYYGGASGYVYRMDVGPSFDGANIYAYFTLAFNAERAARVLKRYRRASVEATGSSYAAFQFGYSMAYGLNVVDQVMPSSVTANFQTTLWDNFTWDSFVWDGLTLAPTEIECNGTAENIACQVVSNSNLSSPFTINSITLHYTPRRGIR